MEVALTLLSSARFLTIPQSMEYGAECGMWNVECGVWSVNCGV
jgi:hypothetical protein